MLFNEDQHAIRDLARRFAREKLAPQYQKLDASGVLDRAVIREMGALGLMGVDLPESFGGLGAPGVTAGIIAEELAYGDFNVSAVPVGVSLLGAIILSSASPAPISRSPPRRRNSIRRSRGSASSATAAARTICRAGWVRAGRRNSCCSTRR